MAATDIAYRTHEPDCSARLVAHGPPVILDPEIVPVSRLDAIFALEFDKPLFETRTQRRTIAFQIIRMYSRDPIGAGFKAGSFEVENLKRGETKSVLSSIFQS